MNLEIDIFIAPKPVKGLVVLEVEVSDISIYPPMPEELLVVSEITGNKKFSNKQISLQPWKTTREAMKIFRETASGFLKAHKKSLN